MRRLRAAARRTVVEAETPAAASEPVQDERDEDGAADDPDDELDRELEGRDDGACRHRHFRRAVLWPDIKSEKSDRRERNGSFR